MQFLPTDQVRSQPASSSITWHILSTMGFPESQRLLTAVSHIALPLGNPVFTLPPLPQPFGPLLLLPRAEGIQWLVTSVPPDLPESWRELPGDQADVWPKITRVGLDFLWSQR